MASYIKFMFKYLFQPENLPADLDQRPNGGQPLELVAAAASAASGGQVHPPTPGPSEPAHLNFKWPTRCNGSYHTTNNNHNNQHEAAPNGGNSSFSALAPTSSTNATTNALNTTTTTPFSSDIGTNSSQNSLELLDCYNQLQLHDYYKGYDIFVGLRIATTLSILFIVFILFVIYKTGCRRPSATKPEPMV